MSNTYKRKLGSTRVNWRGEDLLKAENSKDWLFVFNDSEDWDENECVGCLLAVKTGSFVPVGYTKHNNLCDLCRKKKYKTNKHS